MINPKQITTCYACGTACNDWGPEYLNTCPRCAGEIHRILDGRPSAYYYMNGDGWIKDDAAVIAAFDQLKAERLVGTPTATKEGPCKQCGRKNDVGVSKCWLCECPSPV